MTMNLFLENFGNAMAKLNQTVPGHTNNDNQYSPGIGPYGENEIVDQVMNHLKENNLLNDSFYIRPASAEKIELGIENYKSITGRSATPDLVIGNKIIEFKIARPLRDNGSPEDTWFKKVFDPHPTSYSTFIDVEKLCSFSEKHDQEGKFEKWVVVIGFERHNEEVYKLDALFPGLFKYISENISQKPLMEELGTTKELGNRHPYHQVVKLYGFRY